MISAIAAPVPSATWYSRYDPNPAARSVTATIAVTGQTGDILHITLVRRLTGRPVAALAIPLPATGAQSIPIAIPLDDGATCHDADGIYRAIAGEYALIAQDSDPAGDTPPTLTATSATFRVALIAPTDLAATWLRGAQLRDETRLTVAVRDLAGVTHSGGIDARDAEVGTYALAYDAADNTLAWWDGPAQAVPASGALPVPVRLWSGTRDVYITVQVTPDALPIVDTTGALDITYAEHTDADTIAQLDAAASELAGKLGIALEPRQSVAPRYAPDFPYADDVNLPATDYRVADFMSVRMPQVPTGRRHMRALHKASGYIRDTIALELRTQYMILGGQLSAYATIQAQAVANTAYVLGSAGGAIGVAWYGQLAIADYVPHFWHLALTHGLPDLHSDAGQLVREYLRRDAARRILIGAATLAHGTYSAESFGRDGLSLSRSVAQGQYGPYTAAIAAHTEWLAATYTTLRARLVGYQGSR